MSNIKKFFKIVKIILIIGLIIGAYAYSLKVLDKSLEGEIKFSIGVVNSYK